MMQSPWTRRVQENMDNTLRKRALTLTLLALFFLVFITSSAIAEVPPAPQGDGSGAQASRFQAQAEKAKARVERKELKKPDIEIEAEKPKAEAEAGPAFVLKKVNVTGSSVFKPEDFRDTYANSIDKQVTFRDVETITGAIKAKYKKKGYLTAVVYIPEQDIAGGAVEIRVLEGKAGEVCVEGN